MFVLVTYNPFTYALQIDYVASAELHRTVVKPGVNDVLDEMKRTYEGIEDLLNQAAHDIANNIPPQYSLDLNVIFFPQIGFLITMPIIDTETGRSGYEGGAGDDGPWEWMFSTEERVYYRDARMMQLNEMFGDIYANICGAYRDLEKSNTRLLLKTRKSK